MPEDRQQQHRRERIAEALRDEIGVILEGELADPRIGLATVSEVVLETGKLARVYIAVVGSDEDAKQTLDGLMAAKGFIRHELSKTLGLRKVPDLIFHLDRSSRDHGRVDELLHRIEKRSKKKSAE